VMLVIARTRGRASSVMSATPAALNATKAAVGNF
jgi:hypothetical protein